MLAPGTILRGQTTFLTLFLFRRSDVQPCAPADLAQKAGEERAHGVFAAIAGAYGMRLGDAHPTSSKIGEALKLAGIDATASYLRQGEQLIRNFGHAV